MPSTIMLPRPPKKVGKRWEYHSLVFWAEGGGIYVEDGDPSERSRRDYRPLTLPQWRKRIEGMRGYLQGVEKSIGRYRDPYSWQVDLAQRDAVAALVRAMEEVAKEAANQGDIMDDSVQRYYREHVAPVKRTHLVPDFQRAGLLLPN